MNDEHDKLFRYSFRGPDGQWTFGRINAITQELAEKKLRFMSIPFEKIEAWSPESTPAPQRPMAPQVQIEPPANNPVTAMHQMAEAAQRMSTRQDLHPITPRLNRKQRLLVDEPAKILQAVDELLDKHGGTIVQHSMIIDGKGKLVCSVLVEYNRRPEDVKEDAK